MKTPSGKPRIHLLDFYWYLIGPAMLAGFAIFENPTWPVVIGILSLAALAASVFCFLWSRGGIDTERGVEQAASREEEEAT